MQKDGMINENDNIKTPSPAQDKIPKVTLEQVPALVWRLYGLNVVGLEKLNGYYDMNLFFRAEGEIDNARIPKPNPGGYVLKINTVQSTSTDCIEASHALMRCGQNGGLVTQTIILNKSGKDYSLETFTDGNKACFGPYVVRLVTFIPGKIFCETPYVPGSFRNVGLFVGKFEQIIKGFHHPFYDTYTFLWSLTEVPAVRNCLHAVKDDKDRAVVEGVVNDFEKNVKPEFENFRKGVVHGDINDQNLIMRKVPVGEGETDRGVHDVAGIIDFTDSNKAYTVMDLALTIAYMSIECPYETQLDVGGHILSGYNKYSSLNEAEKKCLKSLVCARLCQTLVYGEHDYSLYPGNEYLMTTFKKGWPLLHRLWETDTAELYSRWGNIVQMHTI